MSTNGDDVTRAELASAGAPQPDEDAIVVEEHELSEGERVRVARPPEEVSSVVDAFVASHGWAVRLRGARLFDRWIEIVGPELAKRCEPVRVAGGTLTIRAENQAWATQLKYMTTRLRDLAAAAIGDDLITEIRIVVGPLEGTADPAPPTGT